MDHAKRIEELAIRRHNLITEVSQINSQLLIEYEQLIIEAGKGDIDIRSVARVLNEADLRQLRKRMPVLSNVSSTDKPVNVKPIVEEPMDSSNVKPHIAGDPDIDVDDKHVQKTPEVAKESTWDEEIKKIKESERYKESVRTNEKNLMDFRDRFDKMNDFKKADFKTKNLPILTARISELTKVTEFKTPEQKVAHENNLNFHKQCLSCLSSSK